MQIETHFDTPEAHRRSIQSHKGLGILDPQTDTFF